ncbi:MAG: right-handed parallel beta-helix repeat-containing protein [Kiritimatiellia bacterium]
MKRKSVASHVLSAAILAAGIVLSLPFAAWAEDGGVSSDVLYVDANSANPEEPYATADTAARTLTDALAVATSGQTIRVAPGTYATTSGTDSAGVDPSAYELTSAITVVGTGETPDEVVFTRSGTTGHRIFYLNNAGARVRNVTICGGGHSGSSTGVGGNVYIGDAGGTLEDCVIKDGSTGYWAGGGGNVGMRAGRLVRCALSCGRISPDSLAAGRKGGSCIHMTGGIVENSLICNNTNGYVAVMMSGSSTLANCTVAGNTGTAGAGVYVADAACKVVNCAIGGNTVSNDATGHGHVWLGAKDELVACFVSCAADVELGEGSVKAASLGLVGGGDCHLGAASVCRDAATDYATSGAESDTDLDGNARQSGTAVDIGCYEFDADALSIDFTANATAAFTGGEIEFTAVVSGGSGDYTLAWDLDGDGVTDVSTHDLVVRHAYSMAGSYSVVLSVEGVSVRKENFISVGPKDAYVDAASEQSDVYKTIQEAYAAAVDGTTIHVAPGEYLVAGADTLKLTKGVSLVGEGSSPESVVLRQQYEFKAWYAYKTLLVAHANAFVANMTIADGSADNSGDAACLHINATGGVVSNCVIRGGVVGRMQAIRASGALVENGLLTHSIIEDCTIRSLDMSNGPKAQGVYVEGNGRLENCLIRNMKSGIGAAVFLSGNATMRNCTVVACEAGPYVQNWGTWMETNVCYGVHCAAGSVVNTVALDIARVAFDGCLGPGTSTPFDATGYAAFGPAGNADRFTTCACDGSDFGEGNFVATTADFTNYGGGDYRPRAGGALSNHGTSIDGWEWLVDVSGRKRVQGKAIDIGCYEGVTAGLTVFIR